VPVECPECHRHLLVLCGAPALVRSGPRSVSLRRSGTRDCWIILISPTLVEHGWRDGQG
jgi:hypothetical protein